MATWAPAPSTAAVSSTGTTKGAGKMVINQTIGVTAQNAPATGQPKWLGAPSTTSLLDRTQGNAL